MIQNIPHGGRARELEAVECLGGKPPLAPPLYARLSGALQPRGSSKNTEQVLVQYCVVQPHKVHSIVGGCSGGGPREEQEVRERLPEVLSYLRLQCLLTIWTPLFKAAAHWPIWLGGEPKILLWQNPQESLNNKYFLLGALATCRLFLPVMLPV